MNQTALIAGATGLVGGELLQKALSSPRYKQVTAIVRKPMPLSHPKLVQQIVDFDHLSSYAALFAANDVFCCLGTTIKAAKTKEAFVRVDKSYPLEMARLAKQQGAGQFLIVTAMGSNPESSVFYNRVKGEVEAALTAMQLPALHMLRPSLLLGNRTEFRLGERIGAVAARALSFVMIGGLKPYRAIQAATVARAMLRIAEMEERGVHTYQSDQIAELGAD